MGAEVRDRRLLEHDLRNAISRGELSLVYQPQKCIHTGQVVGFEALLRWKHPTRGDISPAEFIPIAEESGVILQIGEWVLRTACREAATWTQPLTDRRQRFGGADPQRQLRARGARDPVARPGLPPAGWNWRSPRRRWSAISNRALATLRQIKMLGVRIAMDDFGTGYSSLSNLRAFPFDKIKIDGSFIKSVNANDQARRDRALGARARPRARARRCWPKASRRRPSSTSCAASCATRCRASCSGVPPTSRASAR